MIIIGLCIGFALGFIACAILREQHEIVEDIYKTVMDTNQEFIRQYPETESPDWEVQESVQDEVEARR